MSAVITETDRPAQGQRIREEPVPICEAMNSEHENPEAFLLHWQAEYDRDPARHQQPGVCRVCGAAIPTPHVIQRHALIFPITVCEPCVVAGQEEYASKRAEEMRGRHAAWCPPEFNAPWDEARGNQKLRDQVMNYSLASNRNLLLHGDTGRGKTRALWHLLKHMADHDGLNKGFLFLDAYELSIKPVVPSEAYTTGILILDDIGNDARSSKHEVALLHLIKKRLDWHRPVFITTQLDGAAFKNRFFPSGDHSALAILRRLNSRTDFIAA